MKFNSTQTRASTMFKVVAVLLASFAMTATARGQIIGNPSLPVHYSDFDGDGFDDLVIGVPGESIGDRNNAGAINILYGSEDGLQDAFNQIWHQSSPGDVRGIAEAGDSFGSAVAVGDFNGDSFSDVAVGVDGEAIGNRGAAGAVNVLYGSPAGVTAANNQIWHQDSPGVRGRAEAGDGFGSALAAADFNGDGYTDLVIGVPSENLGNTGLLDHGMVNVLYGSTSGLTGTDSQVWHQDLLALGEDTAEDSDLFGDTLTTGDFNGDGFADLAVGAPSEVVGDGLGSNNGAVNVIYGSALGLSTVGNQFWHQAVAGDLDPPEAFDEFGSALAAGDFDGDGISDLAVGVHGEKIGTAGFIAGAVNVLYGSTSGLTSSRNQFWHQNSSGIQGAVEVGDRFGSALAVGDFNRDGFADLAVGVPQEGIRSIDNAGAVNVLFGSSSGLTAEGNRIWHQNSAGIKGASEIQDLFGRHLTVGDFDGDGFIDLAIGVPGEDLGRFEDFIENAGAVNVLYGSSMGPDPGNNQIWHQNSANIEGRAEPGDRLGGSLGRGVD